MIRSKRVTILIVLALLLLALPSSALASKRIYTARLSTGAELHEVVGSNANGSATFVVSPSTGKLLFQLQVFGLSGPASGAHIHAPADTTQNAPVVVTLCGNPQPGAVVTCSFDNGWMRVSGEINQTLLRGITPQEFMDYLDSGLAYVNVHTALNPAGEARGQIIPQ
jgi:hypothetical protein